MALETPPSQGFLDHPSSSSTPLIPHSSYSLSEVTFHPCTPGTLAPCLWSPLSGCCCYSNGILRALGPHSGGWRCADQTSPAFSVLSGWKAGQWMQELELTWGGGPAQTLAPSVSRQQLPPHHVTWQTPEQLVTNADSSHRWSQGSDFNDPAPPRKLP